MPCGCPVCRKTPRQKLASLAVNDAQGVLPNAKIFPWPRHSCSSPVWLQHECKTDVRPLVQPTVEQHWPWAALALQWLTSAVTFVAFRIYFLARTLKSLLICYIWMNKVKQIDCMKFEVPTAVMMSMVVFWISNSEDEWSMFLRNVASS